MTGIWTPTPLKKGGLGAVTAVSYGKAFRRSHATYVWARHTERITGATIDKVYLAVLAHLSYGKVYDERTSIPQLVAVLLDSIRRDKISVSLRQLDSVDAITWRAGEGNRHGMYQLGLLSILPVDSLAALFEREKRDISSTPPLGLPRDLSRTPSSGLPRDGSSRPPLGHPSQGHSRGRPSRSHEQQRKSNNGQAGVGVFDASYIPPVENPEGEMNGNGNGHSETGAEVIERIKREAGIA